MKTVSEVKIVRAAHLGMCFGVRDAVALAMDHAEPLTILGDLVHNESVLHDLRSRGVHVEHKIAEVQTDTVMITAHGASDKARHRLREHGFNIIEATCPLVAHAHTAIQKLARDGFHPVIIGKREHVEVRGLTEDLEDFDVVLNEAEVEALRPQRRFGIAAQTTQPIERVRQLVHTIERKFPHTEVRFVDTVCHPTKQRQAAAIEVARASDVVIVIGGAHSNNTHELVSTCRRFCSRVYHVQTAADLDAKWLVEARTIGITAGTSTPDYIINGVEARLKEMSECL